MKTTKLIVATLLTIGLAACGSGRDDREETPDKGAATQPEQGSILRPDVAQPEIDPSLVTEPLRLTLPFGDTENELTDASVALLQGALSSPQLRGDGAIILRGHSASVGSDEEALARSQARAEAVKDWLIENGVSEDRIRIIAFGEQNPVAPNALPDGTPNEIGRAANRRVEMEVMGAEPISTAPEAAEGAD